MTVKELIENLQKIKNQDAMTIIQDGKFNDMQVADTEYVEEWCDECKEVHNIVYLKMCKIG